MMKLSDDIITLFKLFNKEGYKLYIVGGAVRDYLLGRDIEDYDFATSAPPCEMIKILDGYLIDTYQEKLGSIKVHLNNQVFEITTFRKEYGVRDLRYPIHIEYVDDLKDDVLRRDFTINSLGYSVDEGVVDYLGGIKDLNDQLIRFNKDTKESVLEDPIRIIRAHRFSLLLNFNLSSDDVIVFSNYSYLVNSLGKIKYDELKKLFKIKGCKEFILKYIAIYQKAYPIFGHKLFINALKSDLPIEYLKYVLSYLDEEFSDLSKKDKIILNGLKEFDLNINDLYQTKVLLIKYHNKFDIVLEILESFGYNISKFKENLNIIRREKHCLNIKDLAITYKDLENLNINIKDYSKVLKSLLNKVLCDYKLNEKEKLVELVKKGDY